jgi:hypothetical protein
MSGCGHGDARPRGRPVSPRIQTAAQSFGMESTSAHSQYDLGPTGTVRPRTVSQDNTRGILRRSVTFLYVEISHLQA